MQSAHALHTLFRETLFITYFEINTVQTVHDYAVACAMQVFFPIERGIAICDEGVCFRFFNFFIQLGVFTLFDWKTHQQLRSFQ